MLALFAAMCASRGNNASTSADKASKSSNSFGNSGSMRARRETAAVLRPGSAAHKAPGPSNGSGHNVEASSGHGVADAADIRLALPQDRLAGAGADDAGPSNTDQAPAWLVQRRLHTMTTPLIPPLSKPDLAALMQRIRDARFVHSLAKEDLLFKFGPWFQCEYALDTSKCVGVGSTATVYCGLSADTRVAFKVMNVTKTVPNLMATLHRTLITELEVHDLVANSKVKHRGRQFINKLLDCQMFPPYAFVSMLCDKHAAADQGVHRRDEAGLDGAHKRSAADKGRRLFDFIPHSDAEHSGNASKDMSCEDHAIWDTSLQVIQVFPLCELGHLLRLCRGSTKMPTHLLPEECVASVVNLLSDNEYEAIVAKHAHKLPAGFELMQRDAAVTMNVTTVLMDTSQHGMKSYLGANMLPPLWLLVLKLQMLLQVLDAIDFFHQHGIIHCDVKLDNVFLTADATCAPFKISAKLSDLGMCCTTNDSNRLTSSRLDSSSLLSSRYTTFVKGTPGYCAPEMLKEGRIAAPVDIYSFAVMGIVALCPDASFKKVRNHEVEVMPVYPRTMHPSLTRALQQALDPDHTRRPKLPDIKLALCDEMERVTQLISIDPAMFSVVKSRPEVDVQATAEKLLHLRRQEACAEVSKAAAKQGNVVFGERAPAIVHPHSV